MDSNSSVNKRELGGVSVDERGIRPYRNTADKRGYSEYGRITFVNTYSDTITSAHQPLILEFDQVLCDLDTERDEQR